MSLAVSVMSCTDNNRAKNYGGSITKNVPRGYKLVNVTWKNESLWIFIRPMEDGYQPVESRFQEKSTHGLVEGTIIFKETK